MNGIGSREIAIVGELNYACSCDKFVHHEKLSLLLILIIHVIV
jgi:hypothetical protein